MKKKILIVSLAIIMLGVAGSMTTLSYFTDTSEVTNQFLVGNTDITLFRWHSDITSTYYNKAMSEQLNTSYEEWLGTSANILVAGKQIAMKPYVTNNGNIDVYVRIKAYFPLELFSKDYITYSYGGTSKLPDEDPGDSEFVRNFANRTIDGKQYKEVTFTRREPLKPGMKTTMPIYQYIGLSTQVLKDESVDLSNFVDGNGKMIVKMTAEAVQSYGFSTPQQAFSYLSN